MDFTQAMRVLAAFARHGVDYTLVGSMAMAAQGLVRATRDMDVFVASDAANVERLKSALRELFNDPAIDEIRSTELAGDYPALQYVPPEGDFWIDILARLGEAFRFADLESEVLEVEGIRIRVATPRMLYRMKKGTVRPQDRVDAEMLKTRFGIEEE
jgi:Nucleotidyl transferase AbiEii toxin, Type IV TA system